MNAPALAPLPTIRQALAATQSVEEVKRLRDQAATIRDYLKRQHEGLEVQNNAAEMKIRCEIRLGELLAATVRHEGGRPRANGNWELPFPGLPEGITKMQSHRWQRIARVPASVFDAYFATMRTEEREITTAGLLDYAPLAIFDAEQALGLASGGSEDEDESEPDAEPTSPNALYTRVVNLFLTVETRPQFLAQCDALRAVFATNNLTDTVAACVAWAYASMEADRD